MVSGAVLRSRLEVPTVREAKGCEQVTAGKSWVQILTVNWMGDG